LYLILKLYTKVFYFFFFHIIKMVDD